jgi:hypothetical protein
MVSSKRGKMKRYGCPGCTEHFTEHPNKDWVQKTGALEERWHEKCASCEEGDFV